MATTGVYCRPSCPARLANRENVAFHTSCREAEAAGFRPCKRCMPNQPSLHDQYAQKVAEACRLIETAETPPSLGELAKWFRSIGLQGCSSHSGRRTFITNAARKISTVGGSLRDVQVLAGHKALSTTQRYIEADAGAQRKVVDLV